MAKSVSSAVTSTKRYGVSDPKKSDGGGGGGGCSGGGGGLKKNQHTKDNDQTR